MEFLHQIVVLDLGHRALLDANRQSSCDRDLLRQTVYDQVLVRTVEVVEVIEIRFLIHRLQLVGRLSIRRPL